MTKKIKSLMILYLGLVQFAAKAQNFAWQSKLDTVAAAGFYTIPLSIDWLVRAKDDLSDMRIIDEDNKMVPFLIKKNPPEGRSSFIPLPVLKITTDTVATIVDIDASDHHGTDHLYLVIGNNAVERFTSLSGSNDLKQWFIIDEKLPLTNKTGYVTDQFVQGLSFPFIRYRFLRLTINNKGSYPLQILKAGIYADTGSKESLALYLHKGTTYSQKDSTDGKTYISVRNPQPYPVDRISMALSGPKFYSRLAKAYSIKDGIKKYLGVTTLRTGEDPAFWVMAGKAQEFLVVIENGDNPPLKVNAINTQCRMQQLIIYLEKGKSYIMLGGNDAIAAPNYDLALFKDSIADSPPIMQHKAVISNNEATVANNTSNKNWWIWPGIVAALLVLSLLTHRLMNDMKQAKV
jgi:hypothetical protein